MSNTTFLVTGASDGIGAVYADRLARRGHDLVLVARRVDKLEALADSLRGKYGVAVETLAADLGQSTDLSRVEARLRHDDAITGLVNNAGIAGEGLFASADPAWLSAMIALNVLAVTRLSAAIAPRLAERREGTIINISSVTALMPAAFTVVYPATKAFVLAFSEGLAAELGPKGVRIQAVLPGITRTAIWTDEMIGRVPAAMVMSVDDMVDAALAGLDLGEAVTIPSLPETSDFKAFLAARDALHPNLSLDRPAARYRA
jgi:short-subunit dehydrogenase